MIVLMLACKPLFIEPDRAGCTVEVTTDYLADGSIDATSTTTYDDDGNVVHVLTIEDESESEETSVFDGKCEREREVVNRFGSDIYTEHSVSTCDEHGDKLTEDYSYVSEGSQAFDFMRESVWDRTYGEHGLSTSAVLTESNFGRDFETEITYRYDEEDRRIWTQESGDTRAQLVTQLWTRLKDEDLSTEEETRDGLGVLRSGVYRTHDDRGREIEQRQVDADRNETVLIREWEPRRRADTRLVATQNGEPWIEVEVVCNEDEPYTERTQSYDGWLDELDGQPDALVVETWTCP